MPREENFTIKFNADINDLKSGITAANRDIQLANAEFKAASAGMDDWGKSSDGLSAKLKQLETVLAAENKKLDSYKKQLALVEEKERRNSKSAEELRKKHAEAVAQYGKNSSEAKKYEKQLTAVEKEMASNEKEAHKLNITILNQQGRVASAQKEFAKFSSELKKVKKAEDEAAKSGKSVSDVLNNVGKKAESASGGFTVLKGAMANLASNAVSSLISGFKQISEGTREMRLEMGKVETAFSTTGFSAATAGKTYDDFYAILGDTGQTTEAVSHLAKLAKTEQDLSTWTNIATGVYATFGASLPIESLTEAANETAKTGELTGGLADAVTWAGMNQEWFEKQLKKCRNEQERQALITKTLNGLYDDAATKYKTVNKDIMASNAAQAKLNKAMADVGQKIAPVTTALQNGFAKVLEKIMELVGNEDLEGFASKIADAFEKLIDDILPVVIDGLKWIIDNKDLVIAGIVGMGAAFAAMNVVSMIQGLVSAFQAFKAAQEGATIAQWLLNAAMSANPIGIVIAAVTGLVAAFVYLLTTSDSFRESFVNGMNSVVDFFKNNWQDILLFLVNPFVGAFKLLYTHSDGFKKFVDGFVKKTKEVIKSGIQYIVDFATKTIPKLINDIGKWFSGLPGKIQKWLTDTVNKVVNWGSELARKGKQAVTDLLTAVTNTIKGIPEKMRTVGGDIVKGLWNGINDMAGWVQKKISGFSESVLNGIKNFFGVHSPSTVMEKVIGNNLVAGLVIGIEKKSKDAVDAMRNLSNGMIKPIKGIVSGANGNLAAARGSIGQAQVNSGTTYNYTQINNSPKALSRLEIYRQTKNALNFATL